VIEQQVDLVVLASYIERISVVPSFRRALADHLCEAAPDKIRLVPSCKVRVLDVAGTAPYGRGSESLSGMMTRQCGARDLAHHIGFLQSLLSDQIADRCNGRIHERRTAGIQVVDGHVVLDDVRLDAYAVVERQALVPVGGHGLEPLD
jgi:hypothetical protein